MTTRAADGLPWIGATIVVAAALSAFVAGPVGPAVVAGALALFVVGSVAVQAGRVRVAAPAAARVEVTMAPAAVGSLGPWIVAAVAVRWVAALALNLTPLWRHFAPDAVFYELAGRAIMASWSSSAVDLSLWFGSSKALMYPYINAFTVAFFDSSRFVLSFVNGLVAVVAAYVFGLLAGNIYGPRAQRTTFLLAAFFPSTIIWTSMNIRESWSYLALAAALYGAHRVRRQASLSAVAALVGGLGMLALLRAYMVPLVGIGIALSFVIVRSRQLPYGILALVVVVGAYVLLGDSLGISPDLLGDDALERVNAMRHQLALGGSAYGDDVDTSTPLGALLYLPWGVLRFLLSPFPWTISSWRQAIAFPEAVAFGYLLYLAAREAVRITVHELSTGALLIFVFTLVTCAYGLASGNEGTAYRHRGQIAFVVFILAAGALARRASGRSTWVPNASST